MKKSTLALVVLFAAALAYYLLVERSAKPPEEAAKDAKRVLALDPQQIRGLRISVPSASRVAGAGPEGPAPSASARVSASSEGAADSPGSAGPASARPSVAKPGSSQSVSLERLENDAWRQTEPVRARADRWACSAVVTALSELQQDRAIRNETGEKGLEEMGLAKPRVRIEIDVAPQAARSNPDGAAASEPAMTKTSRHVLEIGNDVPATSSTFIRIDGKQEIALVPTSAVGPLLRSPQDFRDHALLDLTVLDIGEARVARPEGEIVFRRRGPPGAEDWWVERPFTDLAEGSAVQSLLSSVIGLRADSFIEDIGGAAFAPEASPPPPSSGKTGKNAGASAASTPSGGTGLGVPAITVHLASSDGKDLADIAFGSPVAEQAGKRYVRAVTPGGAPILAIAAMGALDLAQPAAVYHAKKAVPFHTWDVTGLNLISPAVTLAFTKTDGGWKATSPSGLEADSGAVDETVRAIADLDATFPDAAVRESSSEGSGPAQARIELAFPAPAQPKTLTLGAPGSHPGAVRATTNVRPGAFEVPATILQRILGGAALYAQKPATSPPSAAAGPGSAGSSKTTGAKGHP